MLTVVPRPFGGVNLYEKGKLISKIRPYMNSWTFTYKDDDEKFICNVYPEAEEDPSYNTMEKCIEHVQMLLQNERDIEELRKSLERAIFGD